MTSGASEMISVNCRPRSPRTSGRAAQGLADAAALLAREGTGLLDPHAVAGPARVGLVVRLQLLRRPDDALVARMAVHALDPHHTRLLHRVARHDPFAGLTLTHAATPSSRGAPCRPARDPSGPGRGARGSWSPPSRAGTGD